MNNEVLDTACGMTERLQLFVSIPTNGYPNYFSFTNQKLISQILEILGWELKVEEGKSCWRKPSVFGGWDKIDPLELLKEDIDEDQIPYLSFTSLVELIKLKTQEVPGWRFLLEFHHKGRTVAAAFNPQTTGFVGYLINDVSPAKEASKHELRRMLMTMVVMLNENPQGIMFQ